MTNKKGFTLIELLVVVGILAVLAIAALIAINPVEAQRRSRDSARLQDMARLTGSIEAFINDNGTALLPVAAVTSVGAGLNRSQQCGATNWLTVDLCDYLKQVPADPLNTRSASIVTTAAGVRANQANIVYGFDFDAATGNYELCTYLEADKNAEILNDGGSGTQVDNFETGIGIAAVNCGL
jgi:type IV pilus assembly protein PilA